MSNDLLDRPTRKPPDDEDSVRPLFDKDTPQEIYDDKFQEIAEMAKADRVKSPDEINSAEKGAAQAGASGAAASKETQALDKLSGSSNDNLNYTGEGSSAFAKRLQGLITRKRAIGGGAIGLILGGTFGLFTLITPLFQIPQLAQLLQKFHFTDNEEFADGRGARYIRHLASGNAERSRLGTIGNKYGDKWEKRLNNEIGLKSVYGPSPARRFIGYEITDEARARSVLNDLERDGVDTNGRRDGVSGRFIDLSNSRAGARRSVIRTSTRGTHHNKLVASLGSRLLIKRAGVDFHPLKNIKRAAGEKVSDYRDKRKKERAERRREGVEPPRTRSPVGDSSEDEPPVEGETEEEKAAREARNAERAAQRAANADAAREGGDFLSESGDIDAGSPDSQSKLKALTNKFAAKVGGGAAAAVGIMCAAKAIGNEAENLQYTNTILVMLRMAMEIVATGSQIFDTTDVNADEVGSINDDMFDKKEKKSWVAAKSIQAEMGQKQDGPDIPNSAKPSKVGEKPLLFRAIDAIPGMGTACKIDSAVGNLPIIKQVGQVTGAGIDLALKPFGLSTAELTEGLIKLIAGAGVNVFAQGAELGNIVNFGARLAANDAIIAMGGKALSAAEELLLSEAAKEDTRQKLASQSLYERVFNPRNVDSVAANTLMRMPQSPSQGFAAVLNGPNRIFSSLASIGGGKAYAAAEEPYDYGFPQFGFSLEEERDPRFENPFDNAEIMEADNYKKVAEYSEKYGDCFSMKIDAATGNLKSGPAKRYDEIQKKKECSPTTDSEKEEYTRYRFYLADLVAAYSLACYEGDETACRQVGFGDSVGDSGPPGPPAGATIVGDPYTDSTSVACAAGTTDIGTGEGYRDGTPFPVRLCSVNNLPSSSQVDRPGHPQSTPGASGFAVVNSRVSGAWFTLVNDAKTAGITLDVRSSYRTMAYQTALFESNPDPVWVARPGYSSHQAGVALDINPMSETGGQDCEGGRAREPGNPTWEWLFNNAGRYGFKQYSAEAWHWDAYPATNRCSGP